ncbi:hypothetical protein ACFV0G_32390, partial [Kitasatospora sp. NPDC059571]
MGAWAAYLVPMWLRRQDELNESRPTERFSTAIRLLAGRSALERRASRSRTDESGDEPADEDPGSGESAAAGSGDDVPAEDAPAGHAPADRAPADRSPAEHPEPAVADRPAADRPVPERRARLLARRRRMVTALFLAFALGAVVAAVAGVAFIWVPALPAVLLTVYIGHLRRLERQRYEVKIDRARAAQAAERLRAREQHRRTAGPEAAAAPVAAVTAPPRAGTHSAGRTGC